MVIGLDGRMNEHAGDLDGLTQAEADAAVIAWLKERGRLVKRENYRHAVGTCERCHTRIEPLISLQWWCRMEEPAAAGDRGAARADGALPPGVAAPVRDRLARGDARTGASRASSGGGISFRSGRRPTAR